MIIVWSRFNRMQLNREAASCELQSVIGIGIGFDAKLSCGTCEWCSLRSFVTRGVWGLNWFAGTTLITPAAAAAAVRSLTANRFGSTRCPHSHSHRVLRLSGIHCCCFCCCCDCSSCVCCCCGKCSCLAGNHLHFCLLPEAKCQLQVVYVGVVQLWLHLFLFLLFIIQLCARMQCVGLSLPRCISVPPAPSSFRSN